MKRTEKPTGQSGTDRNANSTNRAQGTNNTQIANTAFVLAAIADVIDASPDALNTLNELAAALGNDPDFATTMTNALAGKQPKNATLTALAGLSTAKNKLPYFAENDAASLTELTQVGRDILAKNSVADVLEYLGAGENSKRRSPSDFKLLLAAFLSPI